MMKLTVNDFFCGAGGVGLGFMGAGYEVIWACDFDKYAVDTYRRNVGDHVIQADIKTLTSKDIPRADVWAFGFPCQDLSVAGKRKGFRFVCEDCGEEWGYDSEERMDGIKCPKCGGENYQAASRSGMFFEMMRLLDETAEESPERLPRALFIENVKGLKPYLPVLEAELQKRGYTARVQLYNSKYWGVPQNRERYFIIGLQESVQGFSFPEERHDYVPKLSTVLDKDVDEKYYIDDAKARTIISRALEKTGKPRKSTRHSHAGQSMTAVLEYDGREEMSDYLECVVNDRGFVNRPARVAEICPTLRAQNHGNHPKVIEIRGTHHIKIFDPTRFRVRKLTPTEYGRLQAFPMERWEQVVSDSQAYKQFGNAVTVSVGKAIAERLRACLEAVNI